MTFTRDLQTVQAGDGYVVAGVREKHQPGWGPLYNGDLPITTSLAIRMPAGREIRWRPMGPPSFLAGYPTRLGIVVLRRTPRPDAECAPAVTNDCERWELLLLNAQSGTTRPLLAGSHPAPVELMPQLFVRAPLILFTDGSSLRSLDLRTGRARTVATLPFPAARLSGSPTGTVFAASTDLGAPGALVSVNTATGYVTALGRAFEAVAGDRALAWVEPQPGNTDGASRVRVRPFGARTATAFGVVDAEVYYVLWVSPTALLAVTITGLDLYSNALSAHPVRTPLGPRGWEFAPEVGVIGGDGLMSFGLVGPDSRVNFFAVHVP